MGTAVCLALNLAKGEDTLLTASPGSKEAPKQKRQPSSEAVHRPGLRERQPHTQQRNSQQAPSRSVLKSLSQQRNQRLHPLSNKSQRTGVPHPRPRDGRKVHHPRSVAKEGGLEAAEGQGCPSAPAPGASSIERPLRSGGQEGLAPTPLARALRRRRERPDRNSAAVTSAGLAGRSQEFRARPVPVGGTQGP